LKKVLFLDTVHPILEERLSHAGYQCVHDFTSKPEQIADVLGECKGLVLRSRITVNSAFLALAPNLQWIARSGSGLENIDLEAADAAGVAVINSPEGNSDAVGEHVIGMALQMVNHLFSGNASVREGRWERELHRGRELKHMNIGLIGYGVMGSSVAQKLSGFGSRILAHDKYKTGFAGGRVEEVDLPTIFAEADVVSLHLPQNKETFHYANAEFFAQFAKPIYFINTARGKNVDTRALVDALNTGRVIAASLDVLEFEKASLEGLDLADAEALRTLMAFPQVFFTPHVAGWTVESYFKLSNVLADKILQRYP
jgi:D-3-phosphoglycerate dehydrogenase / 2-oxoglutarate reductase